MSSTSFKLNNKIFQAGAGAGKTTRLVSEVYDYYNYSKTMNLGDPKVVVTTFTRKATQELRERLMLFATLKNDEDFLSFVMSKNKLQITTMHGLMQNFLRQYIYLLGFDPAFKLTDDSQIFVQSKKILKKIITDNSSYTTLLEEFSFKQLVSLIVKISNLKIQYGSSKIMFKFADINDFKSIKLKIINDLTNEIIAVVKDIKSNSADAKWLEYANTMQIALDTFMKEGNFLLLQDYFLNTKKPSFSQKNLPVSVVTDEKCRDLKKNILDFDLDLFDELKWKQDQIVYSFIDEISSLYTEKILAYKMKSGQLCMTDLELLTLKVLSEFPDQTSSFGQSFGYWLIDEYQDTSPIQVDILKKMIGSSNRFLVGDPQQSIYFFRGAREEVFLDGIRYISELSGEIGILNTNYRTQKYLMSFLNLFFSKYHKRFKSMEVGSKVLGKRDCAFLYHSENELQQNSNISKKIFEILNDKSSDVQLGDIAIIARKNDQLKTIAEKLIELRIPFVLHSAAGLQERREIQDMLTVLKFLVVPFDNHNLISLLRSPWFKVKDEEIILAIQDEKENFWPNLYNKRIDNMPISNQLEKLKLYLDMSYQIGITATFEKILSERGFIESSLLLDRTGKREANIWKLVNLLRQQDHQKGFNYLNFIDNYLESFDTESDAGDSDAVSSLEPNRVNLLTVHMSKGLEFKHVFIPYFNKKPQITNYKQFVFDENNLKWTINLKGDRESASLNLFSRECLEKLKILEEAESDRLLYVALTRAKDSLSLFTEGKTEAKSWLERSGLQTDLGIHEYDEFRFTVSSFEDTKLEAYGDASNKIILRNKFKSLDPNIEKSFSVTSMSKKNNKMNISIYESALKGIEIHKLFECLKYRTEDIFLEKHPQYKADFEKFVEYINSSEIPFKKIINDGHAEWGFTHKNQEQYITGQIDLWAKIDDVVWVIDYKTGNSAFKDSAFEQLRLYSKVLKSNVQDCKKINLVAFYPYEQKYFIEELS